MAEDKRKAPLPGGAIQTDSSKAGQQSTVEVDSTRRAFAKQDVAGNGQQRRGLEGAASVDQSPPEPTRARRVAIATFSRANDNRPRHYDTTWPELVRYLTTHKERADKDGPLWSPTSYKPGMTRGNANVRAVSCAVGDFDHGADYATVKGQLAGYEFVAHSTYSSTPEEPRFRVVIPFTRPVSAIEWPEIKARVDFHVFALAADPQAKDCARIYYAPSCPPEALRFAEHNAGRWLDPDDLPEVPREAAAEYSARNDEGAPRGRLGRKTLEFIAQGAPIGEQRARALGAGRDHLAAGYSVSETAAALWRGLQASPQDAARPWTYEDAVQIAEDLAAKPAPPKKPLEQGPPLATAADVDDTAPPHLTDLGNARRLVSLHGADLRYSHALQRWYVWDGRRWQPDTTGEVFRRAKATVAAIYAEAAAAADDEGRKAIGRWATRSEGEGRIRSMVSLAESEPKIPITTVQLDAEPWLLNCLNGTIDLRTGLLREHRRADLLTKLAPVEYDPSARLDLWERVLDEATNGDAEFKAFLQRTAGYAATGDTSEEVLFFVHGPEATGKSTYLEALKAAFGEYAATADFESFLARRESGGPRNDIARLAGARFVASIEVDEGKRLAEGLIKMLTGGDTVSARFLYREAFEFRPSFKLFLAANHAPAVRDDDAAMWRRILRVPFEHSVPKEKRDPKVKATLRDPSVAGPAILAWAVRGCLDWQRNGLGVPPVVERATQAYREAMDPLTDFLEDCCVMAPGAWVSSADLRKAYEDWGRENGEGRDLLKGKAFGERLRGRGCKDERRAYKGAQARGWAGIGLVGEPVNLAFKTESDEKTESDSRIHKLGSDSTSRDDLGNMGSDSVFLSDNPSTVSEDLPDTCSVDGCDFDVVRYLPDGRGVCAFHDEETPADEELPF